MLVPTTTSEPLIIAYLTRSWGNLSSESLWEVAWRVIERCGGLKCGGAAADRHSTMMRASGRRRRC